MRRSMTRSRRFPGLVALSALIGIAGFHVPTTHAATEVWQQEVSRHEAAPAQALLDEASRGEAGTTSFSSTGDTDWNWIRVQRGQTLADFLSPDGALRTTTDVDPGPAPEGDYLGWASFTTAADGGSRILLTNRMTDNVTVFDWATMSVVANVEVGDYPGGIATTDEYAIVACAFSDEVYILDLDDYSVAAVIPTGEQPWVIRVSPDQQYAYVACDIDDTCEVINLTTLTHEFTITGFPIGLYTFGWGSENGRNFVGFTGFQVTPDGEHLVVGDWDNQVLFFNTMTGAIDYTIAGVEACINIDLSGDGSRAVALSSTNPLQVHQIDLSTPALEQTVLVGGVSLGTAYNAAVNQDGSKAFVSLSGNQTAIIRFATADYVTFANTYSAFWIGVSPDHQYAISGQYRFSIIDFANETLVGQHQGNTQYYGAAAPVGYRAIGFDPTRHEGIYYYDYTNVASPQYVGTVNSGEAPEGDAPRRVAVTPDGTRAVVTNVLSDNASIINLQTQAVEAVLPMGDRVQDVAITSDGAYAVVCCFESSSVKLINLTTLTVEAEVPAGSRAGVVSISPDDAYAYVGNISSNTISVIALDGAASYEVAEVYCGVIGVVWAAYGVSSDVQCSPSGEEVLIAASIDDQVKVLDTQTNTIVASLPVGDFPLQIAFDDTGDYAVVTNYFSDNYSVIHVDGAASTVIGTFAAPGGDGPLRLAYNSVTGEMGIGHYSSRTLARVDPETGAFLGNDDYTSYGPIIGVAYDGIDGQSIVLTSSTGDQPGHLHRGGEVFALPAAPAYLTFAGPDAIVPGDRSDGTAAVAMPGPDWVTVLRWDTSDAPTVTDIPLGSHARGVLESPHPSLVRSGTSFLYRLAQPAQVSLRVIDLQGREVARPFTGYQTAGRHEVPWTAGNLPAGIYHAVLEIAGQRMGSQRLTVLDE